MRSRVSLCRAKFFNSLFFRANFPDPILACSLPFLHRKRQTSCKKSKGGLAMQNNYTYKGALEASERIGWRVDDIIGGEKRLDFTKPFMPESLAQVKQISFLTPEEQRTLNQIPGHQDLAHFRPVPP